MAPGPTADDRAFDAARIMNDLGIKKQVKRQWKRLQAEIGAWSMNADSR